MSARVGQIIGDCRIRALLGEGGMGAVYLADHLVRRHRVAVKVLVAGSTDKRDLISRFLNEARVTAALSHPNIVQVLEAGQLADGLPYLVMELLEGETVGERLRRVHQLPVAEAVGVAVQTAAALGAAHAAGIIHRDLKPDNLYLTHDPHAPERVRVKVLDFGIAKLRGDQPADLARTRTGAVLGTPTYMSPEQARGLSRELDQRADIYALGVILYEMLAGTPPFVSEGFGDLLMMHVLEAPAPLVGRRRDVSSALEAIVLCALAKRKEDRFATMSEMTAALLAEVPNPVITVPMLTRATDGAVVSGSAPALNATIPLPVPGPRRPTPVKSFRAASTFEPTAGEVPPRARRRRLARVPLVAAGMLGIAAAVAFFSTRGPRVQLPVARPAAAPIRADLRASPSAVLEALPEPSLLAAPPPAPPPLKELRERRPRARRRVVSATRGVSAKTDEQPSAAAAPAPAEPAPTPPPEPKRKPLIF